ncbi:MAG TPA: carbamoyltransferase HypF [Gemmataceae bacterium]|nr:carbamoyltransferase HypF [Gemmataceae bacterium]
MERRAIAVEGVVQGVGFRPFVHGLATKLGLVGFVRNRSGRVLIEVEGEADALDRFVAELTQHPPPLSHIERCECEACPPLGDVHFVILDSDADESGAIFVSADVATCADCLAELFDPGDRRHGYPFLNCTNCGPRLTIITGAPYDRANTTMVGFAMCPACQAEYEDPSNRRYHAQPTCCPTCGPQLRVLDGHGTPIAARDPVAYFADALCAGQIGALKGLGGYHLACDALSETAVAELRRRKVRDEKPFALMVADEAITSQFCVVGPDERALLTSRRRPIVLLRKRDQHPVAPQVAPGNPTLGVMLPYTPLHHLLLRAANRPLVMTSGNRADEPIAHDDADALTRLAGIADLFLVHDRPIHVRCDDSVTRVVAGIEAPIRRSRGYAPEPMSLPMACAKSIVAVGGQLKGTFALGRGDHAFISHHLGDLDHLDAQRAFIRDLALFEELFGVKPEIIVHDMHPDYASTRYAIARKESGGVPLLAVQHHHAHMASCMAEHGLTGPVIGVSFDGTGFGPDGAIWGGEFLVGDYAQYRRAAHLRYVGMPGGDQAIREPWRMALAHLVDAGLSDAILASHVPAANLRVIRKMLERRFNTPPTSSVGRLFDAVAAFALGRNRVSFEGQAAMQLEWLADDQAGAETYPWEIDTSSATRIIDTRPLIRAVAVDVADGVAAAEIARRFHATLAAIIVDVCARLRSETGINAVVLSGGVFMNGLLTRLAMERLGAAGFAVHRHRQVPPNDGGLCLGQLAIAAQMLRSSAIG